MFFKKPKSQNLWGSLTEVAWDDESSNSIAASERLEVRVTRVSSTVSLGEMRVGDDRSRNETEWRVHGVMTRPKFIPVAIKFAEDQKEFGGFFYNRIDDRQVGGKKISVPLLELWLSDQGGRKAQILYNALRDAIVSGRKYVGVRFWKKKGDGLMTPLDREHGYMRADTQCWG
jgi:hypothetical protein